VQRVIFGYFPEFFFLGGKILKLGSIQISVNWVCDPPTKVYILKIVEIVASPPHLAAINCQTFLHDFLEAEDTTTTTSATNSSKVYS
jgi:hypothetical protein